MTKQVRGPGIKVFNRLANGSLDFQPVVAAFKAHLKLSDAQILELKEAFEHFDRDDDKTINFTEFKDGFIAIGQHYTDNQLQQMFNGVDVDGDNEIDF